MRGGGVEVRGHGAVTHVVRHELGIVSVVEPDCHRVLEHVLIQEHAKQPSANGGDLAHYDVLRNTPELVKFGVGGGLQQDFHGLLEGAAHEGACVVPVCSMAGDGHEVALVCHDVAEN